MKERPVSYDWQLPLSKVSDEQLRAALEMAQVPALLASMVHLTGNTDHFDEVQPRFELMAEEIDGLSESQRARARDMAFIALAAGRGGAQPGAPSEEAVLNTMHRITGEDIPEPILPMLREELNLYGEDRRRVRIDTSSMPADFRVIIIGSGMSGILAAIRLQQELACWWSESLFGWIRGWSFFEGQEKVDSSEARLLSSPRVSQALSCRAAPASTESVSSEKRD